MGQGTGRLSIGSADGHSLRVVVRSRNTPIDIFVELDGSAGVVTACTLTLGFGSQTITVVVDTTLPASDGIIVGTVTTAHLATFGLSTAGSLHDTIDAKWTVTVTDGASSIVRDWYEVLIVAESIATCPVRVADITSLYPDFTNGACDLTNAQISALIQDAWADECNWMANEGPSRFPHLVRNLQTVRNRVKHRALMMLARYMDAQLSGSPIWQKRIEYHTKEVLSSMAEQLSYFKVADPQTPGQQAPTVNISNRAQRSIFGRSTGMRGGL